MKFELNRSKSSHFPLYCSFHFCKLLFEVRTVSYGPSFFPVRLWPRAINQRKKTRIRELQYRPRKRG